MTKPDSVFTTGAHAVYPTAQAGVYRVEPGGAEFRLGLERQEVPEALLTPEMERAVAAWLIARGGRRLNLNGRARPIAPEGLELPPRGPVRRVVSIAPSNAEIVGALGAAELLMGVESHCDFPQEVRGLPRLGPELNIEMDRLAALEPDLVLTSLSVPGMERNVTALAARGIPHLVLAPQSLEEICRDVERVARALGCPERGLALGGEMRACTAALREEAAEREPVPVYLEWWPKPMFTPARACWSNELIALAGGRNVFAHLPGQSAEIDPATLAAADPHVIFLSWCGVPFEKLNPERVCRRVGLEGVRAVREGRVHAIDEALLGRPGPRVLEGIAAMARVIRQVES